MWAFHWYQGQLVNLTDHGGQSPYICLLQTTNRQQSTHHTNSNNRSAATQCSFRDILLDLRPTSTRSAR